MCHDTSPFSPRSFSPETTGENSCVTSGRLELRTFSRTARSRSVTHTRNVLMTAPYKTPIKALLLQRVILLNGIVTRFREDLVDAIVEQLEIHAEFTVEAKYQLPRQRRVVPEMKSHGAEFYVRIVKN